MTVSDLVARINHLQPPFFRQLDPSELRDVVKNADFKSFSAGSVMLRQGYPANKLILLLRGQARFAFTTQSGQRLVLRWLPPGKILGLAALIPSASEYFVSSEAAEDCSGLVWSKPDIRRLAARHPALWENAFIILAEGIGVFVPVHASQTYDSAPRRLARVLLNLAQALGQKSPAGIEINVKNEDLASAANVTFFTTSRLLNEWQRRGLLVKSRGKVVLRYPEGLLQDLFENEDAR